MRFKYDDEKRELIVRLENELDHHEAERIKDLLDSYIQLYMPKKLIFDFKGVDFMDSSGIGIVIGRYKNIQRFSGKTVMRNVGEQLRKVLEISGITTLIPVID